MSVTRSGKSYKQQQAISTRMETPQDIQQCLKLLMEDRQKREEEIAAERAEQEQRYQEERQRRERETEERMKLMQGHIEGLMKMVEGSKSVAAQPAVKLVPLKTDDDIGSYLVTFERIMGAHKIEMGLWPHHLVPQLSGKAQLAFAALATGDISNYDAIKTAILARYDINEESYRNRFRTAKRKDGETSREFGVRLMDTLAKWLKEYKTAEQIREVPQASTGFSPFELIYGREVRGPLDILKETWEADQKSDESVVSYVLATREKLEDMVDCVKQNMETQQARQKKWYDTRARLREFKPGDAVLVLLPTSTNKLLAQWQGPYSVL